MAIPVVKGSKQEMNGIGDIGKAAVLTGQKEEKVIPEDCPFTCDIKYFVDQPTEYKVNVDGKIKLRKKSTRDYAIGAYLYSGKNPKGILLIIPDSPEVPTALYYGNLEEDYYTIDFEQTYNSVEYNGTDWYYLILEGTEYADFTPYEVISGTEAEIIKEFLNDIHAEVRN